MYQNRLFRREVDNTDNAELLINAIKNSAVKSEEALRLIDSINADELDRFWELDQRRANGCELEANVKHTIGTQCAIYLFDRVNGWDRNSTKRGDMLIMAAKLVEKNVDFRGITYNKNTDFEKTVEQIIQNLINKGNDHPPATLNDEILNIFAEAGYDFSEPPSMDRPRR